MVTQSFILLCIFLLQTDVHRAVHLLFDLLVCICMLLYFARTVFLCVCISWDTLLQDFRPKSRYNKSRLHAQLQLPSNCIFISVSKPAVLYLTRPQPQKPNHKSTSFRNLNNMVGLVANFVVLLCTYNDVLIKLFVSRTAWRL